MSYSVFNKKEDCCGCTACANACPKGAIEMAADEEGFLYPQVDDKKCVECGLCKKICAFQKEQPSLEAAPGVYAVKASDEIRMESSSGGAFTILSDAILKEGGVVYGCAFDENFKAVHIRAEEQEARNRCRGSKYSQSELGDTFSKVKADLTEGRAVLFSGTTCQTAALREFLGKVNTEKLFTVDIVCHGTPSPKLFAELLAYIEKKRGKKIAAYYHRPKDRGWGHDEKICYADGREEIKTALSTSWKNVFYSNLPLRPSCYHCRYTAPCRPSDITIADFWGIEKFAPDFSDEKGISLILVSSEKGRQLFEKCKDSFELLPRTMEEAAEKNPNLQAPSKPYGDRKAFWELYQRSGIAPILKIYGKNNAKQKIKYLIRDIMNAVGVLKLAKKILKK